MSQYDGTESEDDRSHTSIILIETPSTARHHDSDIAANEYDGQGSHVNAAPAHHNVNMENDLDQGRMRQNAFDPAREHQAHGYELNDNKFAVPTIPVSRGKHRPSHENETRLTWRSFIGTMSDVEPMFERASCLRQYKRCRSVLLFVDTVLRGIGQVMFANNPLSGIVIVIGLFIGDWELALYGLLGTCVSTLTAHVLEFDHNMIRAGLFGYNGCLTAMGIAYFSFARSPQTIGPVIIMSMFSTLLAMATHRVLVHHLAIVPFTFSFQICTWIWLLGALKYRFFFVNGNILSPTLLTTHVDKPHLSNVSVLRYSAEDNFAGFFASVSQVFFIDNPYVGAIILAGVCVCSRILAFFALFGAVTAQLTAAYLLGLPVTTIHAGLWGYNSVLTCQALGGMFLVLQGYRIWIWTLIGSIMTVLLQAAVASFLTPVGMPTCTFPFTAICWIFCLIAGSKHLVRVKLADVRFLEEHRRRFRLSQLISEQLKSISHLAPLLASPDQDVKSADLSRIKQTFVPILLCSHVHRNDMNKLKLLAKENVDFDSMDFNRCTPLHISAGQGNASITKWLVQDHQVELNPVDRFGGTPLFDAWCNGHVHLLSYLYSHGARLPPSKARELAFYLNAFVYEGDLDAIKCLLSCGFDPNTPDDDGRNALHLAVITNQLDIVRYLLEQSSAKRDATDHCHLTPTDYARCLSDSTISEYLLYTANNRRAASLTSSTDSSALSLCIVDEHLPNKINAERQADRACSTSIDVSLLPSVFGVLVDDLDTNMCTTNLLNEVSHLKAVLAVDYDLRSITHIAAANGQLETIRLLSEQCPATDLKRMIDGEDRWGVSALDEAYRNEHQHIVKFFNDLKRNRADDVRCQASNSIGHELEVDATVRLVRKWKKILLFCTLAASGAVERIETLLSRQYFVCTDVYADYHGRNPMHFAAANGHLNVIRMLVRHGYAGLTHVDRWGNYPLDVARHQHFDDIIDLLAQLNSSVKS
jgi:urea transporter